MTTYKEQNKKWGWEKEFDEKFGQFYLKAFNSGKFFHVNGTSDNQATIDFEAGKDNVPTASGDIKDFIQALLAENNKRIAEKIREMKKDLGYATPQPLSSLIQTHNDALEEAAKLLDNTNK